MLTVGTKVKIINNISTFHNYTGNIISIDETKRHFPVKVAFDEGQTTEKWCIFGKDELEPLEDKP